MASFAGVTFIVDMEGFTEKRTARVAVQEIPGGDTFYVDHGGRGPMFTEMTVLLQNVSLLGALMANLGQTGGLAIDGRDSHTATLMEVNGQAQGADGSVKASLKFVITDS